MCYLLSLNNKISNTNSIWSSTEKQQNVLLSRFFIFGSVMYHIYWNLIIRFVICYWQTLSLQVVSSFAYFCWSFLRVICSLFLWGITYCYVNINIHQFLILIHLLLLFSIFLFHHFFFVFFFVFVFIVNCVFSCNHSIRPFKKNILKPATICKKYPPMFSWKTLKSSFLLEFFFFLLLCLKNPGRYWPIFWNFSA